MNTRHLQNILVLAIALAVASLGLFPAAAQEATEAAETPEATSTTLVGVTWQWNHFADPMKEMDVPLPVYTIACTEDGNVVVQADCNSGSGSYTTDGNKITIGPLATTMMMCPADSLSDDFLQYLSQVDVYSFTDIGDLLMEIPADGGTLMFSAQPQVTGTVTYLVRVALPPGSVVRVQLEDVSRADAPSIVLGEQVIVTNGEQVPLPYVVSYPATAIFDNLRYSVSARITDADGNLLFISDSYIPVITDGNPTSDVEIVTKPVSD